ncbi:hypothetical protein ACPOL_3758 [Acidisarcina polymorpha]|uniref:Uncharacterized protein n=1 Tax=Acidisarcina polymorpha TaxID=2211140 RepID=A0A2Z5G2Y7_9BACT|nr:hypothetical protein ACPOL_3758 [Acidisarcina polymorpha]
MELGWSPWLYLGKADDGPGVNCGMRNCAQPLDRAWADEGVRLDCGDVNPEHAKAVFSGLRCGLWQAST